MEDFKKELEAIILQLVQEKQKMSLLAAMSADSLFEYDIKTDTMRYSATGENGKEFAKMKLFQKNFLRSDTVFPEDIPTAKKFLEDLKSGKEDIYAQFREKGEDEEYHYFEIKAKTIFDEEKKPQMVLGKLANIDEQKSREQAYERLSKLDCMTGLYNKRTVRQMIEASMIVGTGTKTAALCMIDIDHFKEINDSYGHLFGDAVISSVSDEMKTIFNEKSILGRVGGDEFLVYLEDTKEEQVRVLAERFCRQIRNIYQELEDESKVKISCSIGISLAKYEEKIYETLYNEADKALYYIKNRGKNGIEIYDGSDKYEETTKENWHFANYNLPQYDDCNNNSNMHNLLLFSIEVLEKTKEVRSGVKIILDRVGRYFSLDAIFIYLRTSIGIAKKEFEWKKRDCKIVFAETPPTLTLNYAENLYKKYDEFGMAEFTKQEISIPGVYTPDVETVLTIKVQLDEETTCEIIFADISKKREWSMEERSVLKGLSTIFYSALSKENAWETTKRAEYLMRYDHVTGLPNYATFKELSEEIVKKDSSVSYAVIYSGFSNFQYVNDSFGYSVGDAVLARFGKFIQEEYSFCKCCGRITGDQFIVLLCAEDLEEARNSYISCCKQFSKTMEIEIGILNLTIFSGMSVMEKIGIHQISWMIDNANLARKTVRGRAETDCLLFSAELKKYLDNKVKIISTMVTALETDEFQVYLQPKTDLKTGKTIGAEALVRWIKKTGEIIYPDKFIPIFEENGFITKIDFQVLQKVLVYLKNRMDSGLSILPISVNFSRKHQDNPEFVNDIFALLEEYNLPETCVEVEITESIFMRDIETLNENVKKLKDRGVEISIDDFGSGYSSLNVLTSVTADTIKIDKVFLEKDTQKDRAILKYLISMLKNIGFKVVVEGVEKEEQMKLLKETECDIVQGYVIAKPMPMEDFTEYLEACE